MSTTIDWKRAHLLALASRWAYLEEPEAKRRALQEGGYSVCEFFREGETRGLVASNDQEIVVAFRGSAHPENWLRNFTFLPVAREYFELHSGFNSCFQDVRMEVWALLSTQGIEAKELWVTGHSLGGALATILAADFSGLAERFAGIYTFGQPCAGLKRFAEYFDGFYKDRCFRVVNGGDLVSRLPPGFAHVLERVHIGPETRADEALLTEEQLVRIQEDLARLDDPGQPQTRGQLLARLPGLADHSLDLYLERIAEKLTPSPAPAPAPGLPPSTAAAPEAPVAASSAETQHEEKAGHSIPVLPELVVTGEPPVAVHVLWSSLSQAQGPSPRAAEALFSFLCHRPGIQPDVESGVNIPVFPGHHAAHVRRKVEEVSPDQILVVVLLLDAGASADACYLEACKWFFTHASAQVLVVPAYLDKTELLPPPASQPQRVIPSLSAAAVTSQEQKNRAVCRDVAEAICRKLKSEEDNSGESGKPVKVFLNYVPGDLNEDNRNLPLCWLRERFARSTLADFVALSRPEDAVSAKALTSAFRREGALTLVLRTDSFAENVSCQDLLLACKRLGMPIVTIQVLKKHELRSLPYGGNSLTLVWNPGPTPAAGEALADLEAQAEDILDRCLQAWLKHLYFHRSAPQVFRRRELPFEAYYISRPPELLDFAQGTLASTGAPVVMYPDPPLPPSETNLIRHSFPRVRFATPTTLSGEILRRVPTAPLRGIRVVLSLSQKSPDLAETFDQITPGLWGSSPDGPGILGAHLNGTIAHLALSLVRAGAELAYGSINESFTKLLSDLTLAHRRYLASSGEAGLDYLLHCYVAPFVLAKRTDLLGSIRAQIHRIPSDPAYVPATAPEDQALELSRMRHAMAQECHVRVILGGRKEPRNSPDDRVGYAGRFPGQAEEAYQQLQTRKPLYVIGGFGGVAGQVARALQGKLDDLATDEALCEANPAFRDLCAKFDAAPLHKEGIEIPESIDILWSEIARFGRGTFWDGKDGAESIWVDNGLTKEENLVLFNSIQHDEISALILKGVLRVAEGLASQKDAPLHLSLFNGSITEVLDTEAYAVLVLKSAKLKGADGALDARLGGALRRHLEGDRAGQILPIQDDRLSGSYIIPEWIGDLEQVEGLDQDQETAWYSEHIASGVKNVVDCARKNGIASLALVPFGVSFGLSPKRSTEILMQALLESHAGARLQGVTICEYDPDHYQEVLEAARALAQKEGYKKLILTELPPKIPAAIRSPLFLSIRRKDDQWVQFTRSPGAGGAVPEVQVPVDWKDLEKDLFGPLPPPFDRQEELGRFLAESVFSGKREITESILNNRGRLWDVLHDLPSSVIPFELLAFPLSSGGVFRPALAEGIRHGLFTDQVPTPPPYKRKGPAIRLLIVADPTGNLPGARWEAQKIAEAFQADSLVETVSLIGPEEATKTAVLGALAQKKGFDLVHYAGHGHFDPDRPKLSGLLFPGEEMLTEADLAQFHSAEFQGLPLLVVLNACEIGKVDDIRNVTPGATSLAHRILCAGVRGFVANRWEVSDAGAAAFAISLYRSLAHGQPLGSAILKARKMLFARGRKPDRNENGSADWANFMLYGSPDIHL